MINLEKLDSHSVKEIDAIWQAHLKNQFSIPGVENAIIDAVARNENGRLIGYGQLKMFGEAILVMDPTAPRRDRVLAVRQLMLEAFRGADKWKLKDVYAFIKDRDFAESMVKHFGFEITEDPGLMLKRSM